MILFNMFIQYVSLSKKQVRIRFFFRYLFGTSKDKDIIFSIITDYYTGKDMDKDYLLPNIL